MPRKKNGKTCAGENCTKQPNFNILGENKGIYCFVKGCASVN